MLYYNILSVIVTSFLQCNYKYQKSQAELFKPTERKGTLALVLPPENTLFYE